MDNWSLGGFLSTVHEPPNTKVILRGFVTVREKKILARAIEIQNEFSKWLQFSFWTSTALAKILFFRVIINHAKKSLN